jgi:hypothetical protein
MKYIMCYMLVGQQGQQSMSVGLVLYLNYQI